jgi:hypothetical protein
MALLAGQTVSDAAKAANVHRTTVYRWLQHPDNYEFRRALRERRHALQAAAWAHLTALVPKAAACVEAALTAGDSKAALALLKGMGFLPGPPRPE